MLDSKKVVQDTITKHSSHRMPIDFMPAQKTYESLSASLGFPLDFRGEKELLDYFGVDMYYLSTRDISQNEGFHKCWKKTPVMSDLVRTCSLGIGWHRGAYTAKFSVDECCKSPLAGCTDEKQILSYPWPTHKDFDFSILLQEAELQKDRSIVGGLWSGIMGDSYRLIGFEEFLFNIAMEPKFTHTLINTLKDVYMELNEAYFTTMKGHMDIWFFGNDFGAQASMLMSVPMWYEFFYEPIKDLCGHAHSHGLKVMMHSCGSIVPIIDYLIEAGVDILDPIQITAEGMIPGQLSEKFGDRITFHGGIDTQQVLPFGTKEEVASHVRDVTSKLSAKGGYIASSSQIYGDDIPLENILTVYETLREINKS